MNDYLNSFKYSIEIVLNDKRSLKCDKKILKKLIELSDDKRCNMLGIENIKTMHSSVT